MEGSEMKRSMRLILMLGVVLAVAAVVYAPTTFAQSSSSSYTLDMPVSEIISSTDNSCVSEPINLSGTMHFEYSFSTSSDGVIHQRITSSTRLTGVGTVSGVKYTDSESTTNSYNTKDAQQEIIFTMKSRLISQGSTPNMMLRQRNHIVVNAQGIVSSFVDNNQESCK